MKRIYLLFAAVLILSQLTAHGSFAENRGSAPTGTVFTEREPSSDEPKFLVAYFSCTGRTRSLAQHVADVLDADLYEIRPEVPYTEADLNYRDRNSRATLEQNDAAARPSISGSVENMEGYDIVFLGYPIWWGQAPRIISTFLESYDFSGKTIVPFCTSGSSGIGSSAENLYALCSDSATWLPGACLASNASRNDVAEWINGLGLHIIAK
jgi:flavodoxin